MNFLNIPDITLFKTLKVMLNYIRKNLEENHLTPTNSFLYKLCGDEKSSDGRYKYFEQAKKIFTPKIDDPRYIELHMMYNLQHAKPVSICISHSGENQMGNGNGMGQDTNFGGQFIQRYNEGTEQETVGYTNTYTKRFQAKYQLTIVTDNTEESVLIYNILKSLFISFTAHLNFLGLANLKIGGQDIALRSDHLPKYLNTKVMSLDFEYESYSLDLEEHGEILGIIYNGIIKDK